VSKIYLRERQLTTRANIIAIEIDNLEIANKIVTTTKTK